MSTLLYAKLTQTRKNRRAFGVDDKNDNLLEAIAAIIPAEILAIHALALQFMTKTEPNAAGNSVTTITLPRELAITFGFLFVLNILFYLVAAGFPKVKQLPVAAWVRAFIPSFAFVCWTMLQKSTAFDAIFPNFTSPLRFVLAAGIGYLLLKVAEALAKTAND